METDLHGNFDMILFNFAISNLDLKQTHQQHHEKSTILFILAHTEQQPRPPKPRRRRIRRPRTPGQAGTWSVTRSTPSKARRSTSGATTTATTCPHSARSRTAPASKGRHTRGPNAIKKYLYNSTAKTSTPNLMQTKHRNMKYTRMYQTGAESHCTIQLMIKSTFHKAFHMHKICLTGLTQELCTTFDITPAMPRIPDTQYLLPPAPHSPTSTSPRPSS